MASAGPDSKKYVLFRLGEEEYGLPIDQVRSIIHYEQPTPVPRAADAVEGVINLRGNVIPVVNLKRRLLDGEFEAAESARILVAEGEGGQVGLIVDAASEVASIVSGSIMPPPETAMAGEMADAFTGVASHRGRLVILLDLERALPGSEYGRAGAQEVESDG